jgi:hypothetical protein
MYRVSAGFYYTKVKWPNSYKFLRPFVLKGTYSIGQLCPNLPKTHKGQVAATNREKGQGVTWTRAGAAPCKNGLARTLLKLTFFWKEMVTSENLSGCQFQISWERRGQGKRKFDIIFFNFVSRYKKWVISLCYTWNKPKLTKSTYAIYINTIFYYQTQ